MIFKKNYMPKTVLRDTGSKYVMSYVTIFRDDTEMLTSEVEIADTEASGSNQDGIYSTMPYIDFVCFCSVSE